MSETAWRYMPIITENSMSCEFIGTDKAKCQYCGTFGEGTKCEMCGAPLELDAWPTGMLLVNGITSDVWEKAWRTMKEEHEHS